MKARLEFAKKHLKDVQTVRNNIIPNNLTTVKHSGGSIMLWGCFSAAGTGRLVNAISYFTHVISIPMKRATDLCKLMWTGPQFKDYVKRYETGLV